MPELPPIDWATILHLINGKIWLISRAVRAAVRLLHCKYNLLENALGEANRENAELRRQILQFKQDITSLEQKLKVSQQGFEAANSLCEKAEDKLSRIDQICQE